MCVLLAGHLGQGVPGGGGGGGDKTVEEDAYWVVQNSFGTVWGESGYFRIKRNSALGNGEHNLGIEHACSWVMP